jgi:hypothetical protein
MMLVRLCRIERFIETGERLIQEGRESERWWMETLARDN